MALHKTKLNDNLGYLVEEILKWQSTQAAAWVLLAAFSDIYVRTENKRTQNGARHGGTRL
jgi:hypothetical protein